MTVRWTQIVLWVAVGLSAIAGVAVVVVLLRGDPTYLIQPSTRMGVTTGEPKPVSFPFRAFMAAILVASLFVAGVGTTSAEGLAMWPVAVAGYVMFILNVIGSAAVGPVFPAFLVVAWCAVPLPGIVYSETIGDLLRGPDWAIWGGCLVALAARLVWLGYGSHAG